MHLLDIGMLRHLGIEIYDETRLQLSFTPQIANHLETMHAGALYTLAEAQSGYFLQQCFPEHTSDVVPILREGSIKYLRMTHTTVTAYAYTSEASLQTFIETFKAKGRAKIGVAVEVKDDAGNLCAKGRFDWFVSTKSRF